MADGMLDAYVKENTRSTTCLCCTIREEFPALWEEVRLGRLQKGYSYRMLAGYLTTKTNHAVKVHHVRDHFNSHEEAS
jgi:hypothetical protein